MPHSRDGLIEVRFHPFFVGCCCQKWMMIGFCSKGVYLRLMSFLGHRNRFREFAVGSQGKVQLTTPKGCPISVLAGA